MSENLVTMVFTDLVSSTAIKLNLPGGDIAENNRLYRDTILIPHRQRVEASLSAYGGRKVETIGDAFFLVFANPVEAVQWSIAIQMSHINDEIPTPMGPLQITIGIHTGSPLADGDRFIGHEVDYAARVASLASAGQILLSEATEVLVRFSRSTGFTTYQHGDRNLKGIGAVHIFEVLYNNRQPQPLKDSSKAQPVTNIGQAVSLSQSVLATQNEKENLAADLKNKSQPSQLTSSKISQKPSPSLTIPADIQKHLEILLTDRIGPMAACLLQNAIEQASTPQELLERLVIGVPENLQKQFQEDLKKILKIEAKDLPISTQTQISTPKASPETTPQITVEPGFVQLCQVELAKSIGPMATFIVQQTISRNPKVSQSELVETLAKQIPVPQQAKEFRQRLLAKK